MDSHHDHHSSEPGEKSHSHSHSHGHASKSFGAAFGIGIGLNIAFVILEASYGYASNSMALIADAGHNLSDVLGLMVAWIASVLVKRAPTPRLTYGLRGSSILAALFNAMFLLVATGAIIWESCMRLSAPEPVAGVTVMVVATIGIAINGATAWLFASGGKTDINIRGAYLHMMADAAVSAGVVLSALLILVTGFNWLDPIVSLVIAGLIIWGTWGLLRESLGMAMAGVPTQIDPDQVKAFLMAQPDVASCHDLHIWPMSTTEVALTTHLVMPGGHPGNAFLFEMSAQLRDRFGIGHATVQVETPGDPTCALSEACAA